MNLMVLPLADNNQMMIPTVAIAEVIPFAVPVVVNDIPNWVLGAIDWRGLKLPLCVFEKFDKDIFVSTTPRCRTVIINGTQGFAEVPFFAAMIQGIPKVVNANAEAFYDLDQTDKDSIWWARCMFADKVTLVPRFSYIESCLRPILTKISTTDLTDTNQSGLV